MFWITTSSNIESEPLFIDYFTAQQMEDNLKDFPEGVFILDGDLIHNVTIEYAE